MHRSNVNPFPPDSIKASLFFLKEVGAVRQREMSNFDRLKPQKIPRLVLFSFKIQVQTCTRIRRSNKLERFPRKQIVGQNASVLDRWEYSAG